ncbi:MAG: AEC family transporter [Proteobacteria bacterium]|uniref:AEC family transporter n=1 Tax=Candidatus Avisuccinivibrio stercorigallinarum TaxID=2840704 RepID=A0A9D9D8M4_9GAMM|nr:AEC family transporter [Candidatus Avisuccinivibrio stercorigallinarum]
MNNIFLQMGILFLLIFAGYICHKCKLLDHEFDRMLSNFIVKVSCPALVLASTMGDLVPDRELVAPLLAVGVASYFVFGSICWFAARLFTKDKSKRGEFAFMLTFGNVGFIGYPVVASIFGTDAIFFAAVLNFANALFVYSLGPVIIAGRTDKTKLTPMFLFSPIMLASYAAIAIVMFGLKDFPKLVSEPLSMLGSMTVPGALLIIGSSIAQMPLRGILGSLNVYAMCVCRLFIVPFGVYFFSLLFSDSVEVVTINTVLFAMPVATLGIMFCLIAGKDESTMAKATFISTLFSMLTIPCVTTAVNYLNTIFLPG